jgi:flagellar motor switch protein FliM
MANEHPDLPAGEPGDAAAQAAGAGSQPGEEGAGDANGAPLEAARPPGPEAAPESAGDLFSRADAGLGPEFDARGGEPAASTPETLNEALSQGEIEQLLAQVQAEQSNATILKSGGRKTRLKSEDVQPCDFRQPAFLTSGELRKIRLRHEDFIRSLAAHLSIYLRLEVVIHMSRLQTLAFQKFADSLPNPTHLTQFKVEPLRGVCLLDMSPRLGLTFVDRLLGGPAHSVGLNGELSEIEAALLDQVAILILNEWCALWQKIETAHPVLLGHESNGRFLTTSAHDTVMLIIAMEVRLGDCVEQMQLAFPFMTIEPLVRNAAPGAEAQTDADSPRGRLKWGAGFDEVPVQVCAEWRGLELTARQLSTLKRGDVLMLDANCFDRVELCFEQLTKFYGRLGTSGERWAVELTEPAKR